MPTAKTRHLIFDANILIDLFQCDSALFTLISKHVAQVAIPSTILEEVRELTLDDINKLGILLITPTVEQLAAAAARNVGPLSFHDWLCLMLAKERGWACITNDKALRKQCSARGVKIMWEFEMLCLLVEKGGLSKEKCKTKILQIQKNNPFFITDRIVEKAFKRLNQLD